MLKDKLKTICIKMADNKPIVAVAAIATFKAIMRPLYSLANKDEPKKTRHYAALRDFCTEAIAIPSYILMSKGAEIFAEKLTIAPTIAENISKKQKISNVKDCLQFIAIGGTATFIIPYLCNLILPHAMNLLKKHQDKQQNNTPQVKKLDTLIGNDLKINNNSLDKNNLNNPVSTKYNLWKQSMIPSNSRMRIGG